MIEVIDLVSEEEDGEEEKNAAVLVRTSRDDVRRQVAKVENESFDDIVLGTLSQPWSSPANRSGEEERKLTPRPPSKAACGAKNFKKTLFSKHAPEDSEGCDPTSLAPSTDRMRLRLRLTQILVDRFGYSLKYGMRGKKDFYLYRPVGESSDVDPHDGSLRVARSLVELKRHLLAHAVVRAKIATTHPQLIARLDAIEDTRRTHLGMDLRNILPATTKRARRPPAEAVVLKTKRDKRKRGVDDGSSVAVVSKKKKSRVEQKCPRKTGMLKTLCTIERRRRRCGFCDECTAERCGTCKPCSNPSWNSVCVRRRCRKPVPPFDAPPGSADVSNAKGLPEGWVVRTSTYPSGRVGKEIFAPNGLKFRSFVSASRYLQGKRKSKSKGSSSSLWVALQCRAAAAVLLDGNRRGDVSRAVRASTRIQLAWRRFCAERRVFTLLRPGGRNCFL